MVGSVHNRRISWNPFQPHNLLAAAGYKHDQIENTLNNDLGNLGGGHWVNKPDDPFNQVARNAQNGNNNIKNQDNDSSHENLPYGLVTGQLSQVCQGKKKESPTK